MTFKTIITLMAIVLSAVPADAEEDSFRIYDVQGRSLEAKLLQVDTRRGMLELELRNKQRKKVKVAIFSKSDQAYFRDWHAVQEFQSSRLKVEVRKKIVNSRMEMVQGAVRRDIDEISYEITVDNRTEFPIGDIKIEYNIYAEQQVLGNGRTEVDFFTAYGDLEVGTLAPRKSKVVKTEPFDLYKQRLSGGYDAYADGTPTNQTGKIKGVRVKFILKTPSGIIYVRELCLPEETKDRHDWVDVDGN
ncbi:MAG: hypothetical protein V3V05_00950 [Pontiella sp.]